MAQGKTTGTVIESGDGVTQIMPINEGYSLPNTAERADIGGTDITNYLRLLLKRSGYNFNSPVSTINRQSEIEVLKSMKEMMISCKSPIIQEEISKGNKEKIAEPEKPFALPDGSIINVGSESMRAAEIMFNPSIIGFEDQGVHQMIMNSIKRADINLRDQLYKNIVLAGGNTMIQGFQDRLQRELQSYMNKGNTQVGLG